MIKLTAERFTKIAVDSTEALMRTVSQGDRITIGELAIYCDVDNNTMRSAMKALVSDSETRAALQHLVYFIQADDSFYKEEDLPDDEFVEALSGSPIQQRTRMDDARGWATVARQNAVEMVKWRKDVSERGIARYERYAKL